MNALREIRSSLYRAFYELPVTTLMLFISVMCMLARITAPLWQPGANPAQSFPGMSRLQTFVEYPEVHGHFDLWRGDWWRIFGNAFHHANFLHLFLNAMGIWSCAKLVEPAMGRWRYALFFVSSAAISMVPELLLDHDVVGLSGVFFALFGMLLVLRTRDPAIAEAAPPSFVYLGFFSLFLCVVLSVVGDAPIAHGAHAFGLLYGAITGWVILVVRRRWPMLSVLCSSSLYASLFIGVLITVNPTWKGSYFAWHANEAGRRHERLEHQLLLWKAAVQRDSRIAIGWLKIIRLHRQNNDDAAAWSALLDGLKSNRTNDELVNAGRVIWFELSDSQRASALEELRKKMAHEADAWIVRLRLDLVSKAARGDEGIELQTERPVFEVPSELVPQEVLGITKPHPPVGSPRDVDPTAPDSARLGDES